MAIKTFDCNKIKRKYWPLILKGTFDKEGNLIKQGEKILVRMPQKKVFEKMQLLQSMDELDEMEQTNLIYELIAEILSNNLSNAVVSVEEISTYDLEECTTILNEYTNFINGLADNPN